MRPTAHSALHFLLAPALAATLAPALASAVATTASAQDESRSYTGGRFSLEIGGKSGLIGSAEGGAPQHSIAIESWSWGAAAAVGRGAPIEPAYPVPKVIAPRDVASGQASGRRKGWDGTVKGGSNAVDDAAARKGWDGSVKGNSVSSAKFGAIAGAHRDDSLGKPGARIAQPASPPPVDGSITVDGSFPGCMVGSRYANAVLRGPGVRYVMTDVQIINCPTAAGAARSSLAGEYMRGSLSLSYKKVTVRGWNPEKKED
jgi:hypothetical protein